MSFLQFLRGYVRVRRPAIVAASAIVAAMVLMLTCGLVQAQPLAEHVPADAIIYLGWQGAADLKPAYEGSRLKSFVGATDINQLQDFFTRAMERIEKQDKQAAEVMRLMMGLAQPMAEHPTALYFAGIDLEGQPQPMPKIALLCKAGGGAAALQEKIEAVLENAPPKARKEILVGREGELVVLSVGYSAPKAALAAGGKSLASEASFKSAVAQTASPKDKPAIVAYIDAQRSMALVDEIVRREGDPQAKEMWPRVSQALGLRGIRQVVWTSGFDGKEWSDRLFMAAPGPRKGLLKLIDGEPVSDAAMKAIPQTATLAGAARFDPAELLRTVREIAAEIDPDAGRQADDVIAQINGTLKLNLEKDLMAALGDEWVYYTDPAIGGRGLLGVVVVNHLRDEKKATASLAILETFANAALAEQMKDEEMKVAIYQTQRDGLTIHYVGLPLVAPCWAIKDGNLYMGLFPQMVSAAAGHVSGGGKSILDNKDFVAMRQRLGGRKATAVSFMDLPRTAPDSYSQWVMISRLSGFADLFGVQSPAMLLPPLHQIMPLLAPAGSVAWVDEAGWHAQSITPFPGAELLGSDPLGGMSGLQPLFMMMGMASQQRFAADTPQEIPLAPDRAEPLNPADPLGRQPIEPQPRLPR